MTSILRIKMRNTALHVKILFVLSSTTGCSKLIEVNTPTTSISANNVYDNDITATAVLTGIYATLSSNQLTGTDLTSIGLMTSLSSDDLTLYSGSGDIRLKAYYQNNLKTILNDIDFWSTTYQKIYILNLSIEGLTNATKLTSSVKQQLLGEAKFVRALCYFYLVNLYGDVPLITATDYKINGILSRTPKEQIWAQIISDLKEAKTLLSSKYLDATLLTDTQERIRPTKWAAIALLSRSYLYTRYWKNAEEEATEILQNTPMYSLESLDNTFLMNNNEAIWQLQPVNYQSNTEDAKTFVMTSAGPTSDQPTYLSPQLLSSFEKDDNRKTVWIDTIRASSVLYYYPYKYKVNTLNKPLTEYNTVLRLGEQYLIRAEARAQQSNFKEACDDMNAIRIRAGLKELQINEKTSLINAIYHERQVEFFTEWGNRWLDLKRSQQVNVVMSTITSLKGGTWDPNWQLFPILTSDIILNGNLSQNPGY